MKAFYKYIFALCVVIAVCAINPTVAFSKDKTKPFVVVIDAGHGGKDAGACDNNVKEKDINLGVALQLEEMLKKRMKDDVKVVMTRDNDTFYSLQQRADIANQAKGDLFISIHTNSVDLSNPNRTTVSGSSVYVLGLHKDQNNMQVARKENSVIQLERNFEEKYEGFDPNKDESYIIFEMAQKKNLSQSFKFAYEVQKQLVGVAGRKDRGVHQAGFWVLWATSMPSVLVELDFITNPNSAKYIASTTGQQKLAEGIYNAVELYIKNIKNDHRLAEESLQKDNVADVDMVAELVAPVSSERTVISAPSASRESGANRRTGVRKRRSDYAREISKKRSVEIEDIILISETRGLAKIVAPSQNNNVNLSQESQEDIDTKAKKGKKQKKQKTVKVEKVVKETKVATVPMKQNNTAVPQVEQQTHQPAVQPTPRAERVVTGSGGSAVNRPSTRSKRSRYAANK